jgi:hypothetical protein
LVLPDLVFSLGILDIPYFTLDYPPLSGEDIYIYRKNKGGCPPGIRPPPCPRPSATTAPDTAGSPTALRAQQQSLASSTQQGSRKLGSITSQQQTNNSNLRNSLFAHQSTATARISQARPSITNQFVGLNCRVCV